MVSTMARGPFRHAVLVGTAGVLLAAATSAQSVAAHAAGPFGPRLLLVGPALLPIPPSDRAELHAHVVNIGTAPTTASTTMLIHLPPGVFVATPFSPASCTPFPLGHAVSCTFPAGLGPGQEDTAVIPVVADQQPLGTLLSGEAEIGPPGSPAPLNNPAAFPILFI
jgi:hypothetical protein